MIRVYLTAQNFMFETGKENLPTSASISATVSSDVVVPSPSRKTPIRPLTAAYQAASSDLEVTVLSLLHTCRMNWRFSTSHVCEVNM